MDRLSRIHAFQRALEDWGALAMVLVDAVEAYRVAHAAAFNEAKGTDTARKAAADQLTSEQRLARNRLEVQERKAFHLMVFLRGPGDAEPSRS